MNILEIWNEHGLLILDIIGTLIGLWYLWLEYRASITLWIVGIIMPTVYLFTYYKAGLYADFGLQVYYLIATAYGWLVWKSGRKQQNEDTPITHISRNMFIVCTLLFLVLWGFIYEILIRFTDSNVPVCDAFINALSIIALWLLAHKRLEQWLVWMIVDITSCILYIYKDIPFTAGLYGLYAVIAIFGYKKWKQLMKEKVEL